MRSPSMMALCAGLLTGLGCFARDIAHEAARTAVGTTLRSLSTEENQRLVLQILNAPESHEAARAFTNQLADASLDALSEAARAERIEALSSRYVAVLTRTVTRGIADGLRRDLAPVMSYAVRQAVDSAMREALSERNVGDLQRLAAGVTRATVDAASRGITESLARELPPALEAALTDPRTTRSLGAAAHIAAREVLLGSNDALTQIQLARERGARPSLLTNLTELSRSSAGITRWMPLGVLALFLALCVWSIRLGLRSRRLSMEQAQPQGRARRWDAPSGGHMTERPGERLCHTLEGSSLCRVLPRA